VAAYICNNIYKHAIIVLIVKFQMSLPVQIVPIKTFVGIGMQLPTFRANALRLELLLIILLTCHRDLYRKLKKMEEHFSFFHSCTHTLWRILRNHYIYFLI
jgi:hypothetical protein